MTHPVKGCPVCGLPHAACGRPFTGSPVDLPAVEAVVAGELKNYDVVVNGVPTTIQLTEEDAANLYGVGPLAKKTAASDPETTTAGEGTGEPVTAKTRTGTTKARAGENK